MIENRCKQMIRLKNGWYGSSTIDRGCGHIIAICAKVWNHVNLPIFAFSEVGTCSASIAITSLSIIIIFVVLESPNSYLLHNVVYMPGNLIIKCICERPSFETVQAQESFYGQNFYVQSHTSM